MRMNRKYEQGSVTIFLSMIILSMLSVVMVLLELARVPVMRYKAGSQTRNALQSTFGGYVRNSWDQYYLLMYWGNDDNLEKEIAQFILDSNRLTNKTNTKYHDFFQTELLDVSVEDVTHITADNGKHFAGQINEVMQYVITEEIADSLIDKFNIMNNGQEIEEILEETEEQAEDITNLEKQRKKLYKQIEKLKQIKLNPEEEANKLAEQTTSAQYRKLKKAWKKHNKAYEKLDKVFKKYKDAYKDMEKTAEQVDDVISGYEVSATNAVIGQIKEEQASGVEQLQQETQEITDIENQLQLYHEKLKACENFLAHYTTKMMKNEKDNFLKGLTNLQEEIADFEDTIPSLAEQKEQDIDLEDFSDLLKKMKKGTLSLVVGNTDEISPYEIEKDDLPSVTESYKKGSRTVDLEKVAQGEYCLRFFGNYVKPAKEDCLQYGVEYILGGKLSDQDNLEYVVKELVKVRAGCNMIHILSSTVKKQEASVLATSLTAWTGIPALAVLGKYVLIQAWAYCEAVIDVRDLLEGKKVPLIKTDSQWTLALEKIVSISSNVKSSNSGNTGLEYDMYLRFLLAVQKENLQRFRCMDLIQQNLRKENDSFRMKECIIDTSIHVEFYGKPVFLGILGLSQNVKNYKITIEDKMNYS